MTLRIDHPSSAHSPIHTLDQRARVGLRVYLLDGVVLSFEACDSAVSDVECAPARAVSRNVPEELGAVAPIRANRD